MQERKKRVVCYVTESTYENLKALSNHFKMSKGKLADRAVTFGIQRMFNGVVDESIKKGVRLWPEE